MATQAQPPLTRAEINRQNSSHSTGPRTLEGKNKVRTNAVTHGLSGRDVLLEPAEEHAYNELFLRLKEVWVPVTREENDVILAIRDAKWRLNSIPALQINLMALATEEHMELYEEYADKPETQRSRARIAGYRANMRLFEQFSRHEGRLQRTVASLTKQLAELIANRKTRERDEKVAAAAFPAAQTATKQSQPAVFNLPPASLPSMAQIATGTQPALNNAKTRIQAAMYPKY